MAVIAGGGARPSIEGMRHDGRSGMPRKTAPREMEKVDQARHPVRRPFLERTGDHSGRLRRPDCELNICNALDPSPFHSCAVSK